MMSKSGEYGSNYQLGQMISSPQSIPGVVQMARKRSRLTVGDMVMVKRYMLDSNTELDRETEEITAYIQHEVTLMKQLSHPNVQSCLTSFVVNQEVWVVTPLQSHGSVRDLISTHFPQGLPELACTFLARDIVNGLVYLHSQGVVHRSVRSSHILVSQSGTGLLSGFRYATDLHTSGENKPNLYNFPLHGVTTNLCWLAPEILQQNLLGYNETSDIYSLAVTLCEMANGLVPFSDLPPTLMLLEKLRGSSPHLMDCSTMGQSPAPILQPADSGVGDSVGPPTDNSIYYERSFSRPFHDLVTACSSLDSVDRPSAKDLLVHPWLRQLKKTNSNLLTLLQPMETLISTQKEDIVKEMSDVVLNTDQSDCEWIFE